MPSKGVDYDDNGVPGPNNIPCESFGAYSHWDMAASIALAALIICFFPVAIITGVLSEFFKMDEETWTGISLGSIFAIWAGTFLVALILGRKKK